MLCLVKIPNHFENLPVFNERSIELGFQSHLMSLRPDAWNPRNYDESAESSITQQVHSTVGYKKILPDVQIVFR